MRVLGQWALMGGHGRTGTFRVKPGFKQRRMQYNGIRARQSRSLVVGVLSRHRVIVARVPIHVPQGPIKEQEFIDGVREEVRIRDDKGQVTVQSGHQHAHHATDKRHLHRSVGYVRVRGCGVARRRGTYRHIHRR